MFVIPMRSQRRPKNSSLFTHSIFIAYDFINPKVSLIFHTLSSNAITQTPINYSFFIHIFFSNTITKKKTRKTSLIPFLSHTIKQTSQKVFIHSLYMITHTPKKYSLFTHNFPILYDLSDV